MKNTRSRPRPGEERFARGHRRPDFEGFDVFGGPRGFGGPRRGRGRARRGDVRAAVLALLSEQPMHGYEMIQVLEERTNGVWRPSPGSIYPTLQLLEDEGLVSSDNNTGKRLFTLTDAGHEAVAGTDDTQTPWDKVTEGIDPTDAQLRRSFGQTAVALQQVAMAGTPDQKARAIELISGVRRSLYGILAEED